MASELDESAKAAPSVVDYYPPHKIIALVDQIINADAEAALELERSLIRATYNGLRDSDPSDQPALPESKE